MRLSDVRAKRLDPRAEGSRSEMLSVKGFGSFLERGEGKDRWGEWCYCCAGRGRVIRLL